MALFKENQETQIESWINGSEFKGTDGMTALMGWVSENTKKKKTRGTKKDEDPTRIKRPIPASWMFREEQREAIQEKYFEGQAVKGAMIAKKAAELWESMSEEDRKPYNDRREQAWEIYKESNPIPAKRQTKQVFNLTDPPSEIPSDWTGPFDDKYLWKFIPGLGKKIGEGRFDTFEAAMEAANALPECGGITLGTYGYTLRLGVDPMTDTLDSKFGPFTSWKKSGFTPRKARSPTPSIEDDSESDSEATQEEPEVPEKEPEAPEKEPEAPEKEPEAPEKDTPLNRAWGKSIWEDKQQEPDEKYNDEYSKQLINKKTVVSDLDTKFNEVPGPWPKTVVNEAAIEVVKGAAKEAAKEEAKIEARKSPLYSPNTSDTETDEDDDGYDAEVEPWTDVTTGTEYYLDTTKNTLYSFETQEEVGIRKTSKKNASGWRVKLTSN